MNHNNDLLAYNGAWIYPVAGGWEGNLRGFHYSADSLDKLKTKIDVAVKQDDPGNTLKLYSVEPKRYSIFNEDGEETDGPEWLVRIKLVEDEYDDSLSEDSTQEVVLTAPDFDTAVKYAQQYIRKQSHDDPAWFDAEILSINKR